MFYKELPLSLQGILMGFGPKDSIFDAQIGCVEESKLNFADMRLFCLDHVTYL